MRPALVLLTALPLFGCSDYGSPPTAPTAQTPQTRFADVYAMVADDSGACILGAKVEIVAGQGLGLTATQDQPCNIWDVGGVLFPDLEPGKETTLRASAPGYVVQEKTVLTSLGPWETLVFTLRRSR